jgi:hypothetical protein
MLLQRWQSRGVDLAILDIRSGNVALLEPLNAGRPSPIAFSRDGKLLLDNFGNVWDVATGLRHFAMPQSRGGHSFSDDGRHVIGVVASGSHIALAYYDASTGKPVSTMPLTLPTDDSSVHIHPADASGRWLIVSSRVRPDAGARWRAWLAKVPLFPPVARSASEMSVLVDTATGHEVARGTGWWQACTYDGNRVLSRSGEIWDLSPRRQLAYFWLTGVLYTGAVLFGYLLFRPARRSQAGSPHRPSPSTAAGNAFPCISDGTP